MIVSMAFGEKEYIKMGLELRDDRRETDTFNVGTPIVESYEKFETAATFATC